MTYEEIFAKAKELIMQCKADTVEGNLAAQINIEGEGEGIFYIEVKDGVLSVEPYNYYDNDCVITAASDKVAKLAGARIDLVKANARGDIKIEGEMDKAVALNALLKSGKKPAAKKATPKAEEAKSEKPAKAKTTKKAAKADK